MGPADQPHQPDPRARGSDRTEQVRDPRLRARPTIFCFTQFELPWALGPPDGRYLLRLTPEQPTHVLVIATLGAPPRRRIGPAPAWRQAPPQPPPSLVTTGRATVIDVGRALCSDEYARAWLQGAGEDQLAAGLTVLNRALHAFRLVTADPLVHEVGRSQTLTARIGFGAGEQVADGLWTEARELLLRPERRRRRAAVLAPQAGLAAVLAGRRRPLVCEELALRARLDLDRDRPREAALQLLIALDAALAELPADPAGAPLAERLAELRAQREPVARAGAAALAGPPTDADREAVAFALTRLEALLRARGVTGG